MSLARHLLPVGLIALASAWSAPAHACTGLTTASGDCVYRMTAPGEMAAMEHEAPRTPDQWRRCLAAGEPSAECPDFVFYRGEFDRTGDQIAKQKMSIIVWQAARAAFRCETRTFDRFQDLIATNFSGVDEADHAETLAPLTEMQAYIEETC
ncbi:MAG: hypothetical protein AAGE80_10805 [Pseudomonadota bacterium]